MHLMLVISGILFAPQAWSLQCNECRAASCTSGGEQSQCSAEFTHCATVREAVYVGNNLGRDDLFRSCSKADDCNGGSLDAGLFKYVFRTTCCETDLCNTDQPSLSNLKSSPNGRRCFHCDEKSDCTGTMNCEGDETFCATLTDVNMTFKGCATRSMCVNPPSVLHSDVKKLQCCEGDFCNGCSSSST